MGDKLGDASGTYLLESLIEILPIGVALDTVMTGVVLKANSQKCAMEPSLCRMQVCDGTKANLCIQVLDQVQVKTA